MKLFKTSIYTSVSTAFTVLSGILINKFISVKIGPSGLAIVGQFQNFINVVRTLGNGGVNDGIIKFSAEYKHDNERKERITRVAAGIIWIYTGITSVLLICFRERIAEFLFKNVIDYNSIFIIIAGTLILFVFNNFFLSILIGLKEVQKYVVINILSSIITVILNYLFIVLFSLYGALLSLVVNYAIVFFITLFLIRKFAWFNYRLLLPIFNLEIIKQFLHFFLISISSTIVLPITLIVVRNIIADIMNWDFAGYWQAMFRIYSAILIFLITALRVYFIPFFSESHGKEILKNAIFNTIKLYYPILLVGLVILYVVRNPVIGILYSDKFIEPLGKIFLPVILALFADVINYIISYYFIANIKVSRIIIKELLFSFSFILISYILIKYYGFFGIGYAFLISKVIQTIMLFILVTFEKKQY